MLVLVLFPLKPKARTNVAVNLLSYDSLAGEKAATSPPLYLRSRLHIRVFLPA